MDPFARMKADAWGTFKTEELQPGVTYRPDLDLKDWDITMDPDRDTEGTQANAILNFMKNIANTPGERYSKNLLVWIYRVHKELIKANANIWEQLDKNTMSTKMEQKVKYLEGAINDGVTQAKNGFSNLAIEIEQMRGIVNSNAEITIGIQSAIKEQAEAHINLGTNMNGVLNNMKTVYDNQILDLQNQIAFIKSNLNTTTERDNNSIKAISEKMDLSKKYLNEEIIKGNAYTSSEVNKIYSKINELTMTLNERTQDLPLTKINSMIENGAKNIWEEKIKKQLDETISKMDIDGNRRTTESKMESLHIKMTQIIEANSIAAKNWEEDMKKIKEEFLDKEKKFTAKAIEMETDKNVFEKIEAEVNTIKKRLQDICPWDTADRAKNIDNILDKFKEDFKLAKKFTEDIHKKHQLQEDKLEGIIKKINSISATNTHDEIMSRLALLDQNDKDFREEMHNLKNNFNLYKQDYERKIYQVNENIETNKGLIEDCSKCSEKKIEKMMNWTINQTKEIGELQSKQLKESANIKSLELSVEAIANSRYDLMKSPNKPPDKDSNFKISIMSPAKYRPKVCDSCGRTGHIFKDCTDKKCDNCSSSKHMLSQCQLPFCGIYSDNSMQMKKIFHNFTCNKCGGFHSYRDCPSKIKCRKCGKIGHQHNCYDFCSICLKPKSSDHKCMCLCGTIHIIGGCNIFNNRCCHRCRMVHDKHEECKALYCEYCDKSHEGWCYKCEICENRHPGLCHNHNLKKNFYLDFIKETLKKWSEITSKKLTTRKGPWIVNFRFHNGKYCIEQEKLYIKMDKIRMKKRTILDQIRLANNPSRFKTNSSPEEKKNNSIEASPNQYEDMSDMNSPMRPNIICEEEKSDKKENPKIEPMILDENEEEDDFRYINKDQAKKHMRDKTIDPRQQCENHWALFENIESEENKLASEEIKVNPKKKKTLYSATDGGTDIKKNLYAWGAIVGMEFDANKGIQVRNTLSNILSEVYSQESFASSKSTPICFKSSLASNNIMELLALYNTLAYIEKHLEIIYNNQFSKIVIYTDSQYIFNAIYTWLPVWSGRNYLKSDNTRAKNIEPILGINEILKNIQNIIPIKIKHINSHKQAPTNYGKRYFKWRLNDTADKICTLAKSELNSERNKDEYIKFLEDATNFEQKTTVINFPMPYIRRGELYKYIDTEQDILKSDLIILLNSENSNTQRARGPFKMFAANKKASDLSSSNGVEIWIREEIEHRLVCEIENKMIGLEIGDEYTTLILVCGCTKVEEIINLIDPNLCRNKDLFLYSRLNEEEAKNLNIVLNKLFMDNMIETTCKQNIINDELDSLNANCLSSTHAFTVSYKSLTWNNNQIYNCKSRTIKGIQRHARNMRSQKEIDKYANEHSEEIVELIKKGEAIIDCIPEDVYCKQIVKRMCAKPIPKLVEKYDNNDIGDAKNKLYEYFQQKKLKTFKHEEYQALKNMMKKVDAHTGGNATGIRIITGDKSTILTGLAMNKYIKEKWIILWNSTEKIQRENYTLELSEELVKNCINRQPNKATGTTGNSVAIITNKNIHNALNQKIREAIRKGKIPRAWKKTRLCPLSKESSTTPEVMNIRPIMIMSLEFKIIERIWEHYNATEIWKFISKDQYGFRRRSETQIPILKYKRKIHEFNTSNKKYATVFVDLEKAYDNVNRLMVFKKLKEIGMESHFINMLKDMWSEMVIEIGNGGDKVLCDYTSGIPQGTVLGPMLFDLAINQFLTELANVDPDGFTSAYADDIQVTVTQPIYVKKVFDILKKYSDKGFKYSKKKTQILVGKNDAEFTEQIIKEYPEAKDVIVDKYRYLGVIIKHNCSKGQIKADLKDEVENIVKATYNEIISIDEPLLKIIANSFLSSILVYRYLADCALGWIKPDEIQNIFNTQVKNIWNFKCNEKFIESYYELNMTKIFENRMPIINAKADDKPISEIIKLEDAKSKNPKSKIWQLGIPVDQVAEALLEKSNVTCSTCKARVDIARPCPCLEENGFLKFTSGEKKLISNIRLKRSLNKARNSDKIFIARLIWTAKAVQNLSKNNQLDPAAVDLLKLTTTEQLQNIDKTCSELAQMLKKDEEQKLQPLPTPQHNQLTNHLHNLKTAQVGQKSKESNKLRSISLYKKEKKLYHIRKKLLQQKRKNNHSLQAEYFKYFEYFSFILFVLLDSLQYAQIPFIIIAYCAQFLQYFRLFIKEIAYYIRLLFAENAQRVSLF